MLRTFVIAIALLLNLGFAVGQGSHQKEELLEARKDAQEAPKNRKTCDKLSFPASLSNNRCFTSYPNESVTWGKGFSDGLAKVTVNGKVGFIDATGKLVIPAKFYDAGRFSEGLAPFENAHEKWGYIDSTGRIVVPPRFDWAIPFEEGLALVQVGKLWGYIDNKGAVAIEPKFEEAESFSEGFAAIGYYDKDLEWMAATPRKGRWVRRFIDKTGAWGIDRSFDGIDRGFTGGLAIVSRDLGYSQKYQGMIVESIVIDKSGRDLWKLESDSVNWFSDDAIVVETDRPAKGFSLYNFKDRNGRLLCAESYDDPSGFSEGLSTVRVDEKYGFINKKCEVVIPPQFKSADGFSDGLAYVEDQSGRRGFIDHSGKWIFETSFGWVGGFSDGFALVLDGDRAGYLDRSGHVIWRPTK